MCLECISQQGVRIGGRMGWEEGRKVLPSSHISLLRAPLKTVPFRDCGVSFVLKSSCNRLYTPVFRARLPCTHKKILVLEVPLILLIEIGAFFYEDRGGELVSLHVNPETFIARLSASNGHGKCDGLFGCKRGN